MFLCCFPATASAAGIVAYAPMMPAYPIGVSVPHKSNEASHGTMRCSRRFGWTGGRNVLHMLVGAVAGIHDGRHHGVRPPCHARRSIFSSRLSVLALRGCRQARDSRNGGRGWRMLRHLALLSSLAGGGCVRLSGDTASDSQQRRPCGRAAASRALASPAAPNTRCLKVPFNTTTGDLT